MGRQPRHAHVDDLGPIPRGWRRFTGHRADGLGKDAVAAIRKNIAESAESTTA